MYDISSHTSLKEFSMFNILLLYLSFTINAFVENGIMSMNPYPLLIPGMRILGAGIILLLLHFIKSPKFSFSELKQLKSMFYGKYILCLYVFTILGSAWSMQYMDPIKACFVFVLAPFITALILYFFYKENLTLKKILGLMIGFFAVIPIIFASKSDVVSEASSHLELLSYGVYALAVTSFAYGWVVYNKEIKDKVTLPPLLVKSIAMILGGIIVLFIFLFTSYASISSISFTSSFWWELLSFIALTAFGYKFYSFLLHIYSATFLSFASFLQPALALIIGVVFFKQSISMVSIGALIALSGGLFLFSQDELKLR